MEQAERQTCPGCGADKVAGALSCRFCDHVTPADNAVPCWNCKAQCEWGIGTCPLCGVNLDVLCVACQTMSPHHLGKCYVCGAAYV